MRYLSRVDKNMTVRWEKDAPSAWGRAKTGPRGSAKVIHKFYSKYQHSHEGGNGKTYGHTKEGVGRNRFEAGDGRAH